jgi:hypothetical protein
MTVSKFDEQPEEQFEPVDEVRLFTIVNPAPVPLEPGDLPTSYGRNRLVLLVVDPYLIHVYWDLDSAVPPAAGARPILRFHESQADQTRPFDVDIDFTTSSWYVNLWSPGKVYYADVGWRNQDGSFIQLARSNVVDTPPAWPCPAETRQVAIAASPAEGNVAMAGSPAPKVEPPPVTQHADSFAHLQSRLAELYAIRGELPPLHEPVAPDFEPEEEIPGEPSQPEVLMPPQELDLTQLSEERFTPGISSRQDPLGS